MMDPHQSNRQQLIFYLFLIWSQQTRFHRDGCRRVTTDQIKSNLSQKRTRGLGARYSQCLQGVNLMVPLDNLYKNTQQHPFIQLQRQII